MNILQIIINCQIVQEAPKNMFLKRQKTQSVYFSKVLFILFLWPKYTLFLAVKVTNPTRPLSLPVVQI